MYFFFLVRWLGINVYRKTALRPLSVVIFTSTRKCEDDVSFSPVDLDKSERRRVAPHLKGQTERLVHVVLPHVRGVPCNPTERGICSVFSKVTSKQCTFKILPVLPYFFKRNTLTSSHFTVCFDILYSTEFLSWFFKCNTCLVWPTFCLVLDYPV